MINPGFEFTMEEKHIIDIANTFFMDRKSVEDQFPVGTPMVATHKSLLTSTENKTMWVCRNKNNDEFCWISEKELTDDQS